MRIAVFELLPVAGLAVAGFAATNIDDILLLAVFFADRTLRPSSVVAGQFAGIGLLTLVSAVAAFLALAIPVGWIAFLGLVPLALGIRGLLALWQLKDRDDWEEQAEIQAVDTEGRSRHSQWMSVAAVTVANGGDNLGVYVPLFSREASWMPMYAAVFAVMTAIWCAVGYGVVNHPLWGARVRHYGHIALPFVLLGLGLLILSDVRVLLQ